MNEERIITFEPAYDCIRVKPCVHGVDNCTNEDATQPENRHYTHGIHGVTMRMIYKKNGAATQFVLYTGWYLPETPQSPHGGPMAADLGYHSPFPQYDSQEEYGGKNDDCEVLGGVCYYDGSGLNAERPWNVLRREGGEAVWKLLAEEWDALFGEKLGIEPAFSDIEGQG